MKKEKEKATDWVSKLTDGVVKLTEEAPRTQAVEVLESAEKLGRDELIMAIYDTYNKYLLPVLKKAEVGEVHIKIGKKQDPFLVSNWLKEIIYTEATAFLKVFEMLPKETWDNYKIFKLNDLIEVRMLKEVKTAFLKKWKSRPASIRRLY